MNQQCANCYIRKFCYEEEPEEDWTCNKYVYQHEHEEEEPEEPTE